MIEVRFSAAARRDLRMIRAEGRRKFGSSVSNRWFEGLERLVGLLSEHPHAGQERPEFQLGIRALSHRPYRLIYRVLDDVVLIDRILHQARDVRRVYRTVQ